MLSRLVSATSLMLRHGPRTVLLAREAKLRGAAQKKGELRPLISRLRKRRLETWKELKEHSVRSREEIVDTEASGSEGAWGIGVVTID